MDILRELHETLFPAIASAKLRARDSALPDLQVKQQALKTSSVSDVEERQVFLDCSGSFGYESFRPIRGKPEWGKTTTRNEEEMSIKRIMLLTSMALAAIAFAAPASAQAIVQLTDPAGTALAKGAKVTATATDLTTTTEKGTLACELVTLHLELTNAGTKEITLKQLGEATTQKCHLVTPTGQTLPVTITDGTLGVGNKNVITVNTWGTAETNATFVSKTYLDAAHTMLFNKCHFEGKVHVQAAKTGTDVLNVNPSNLTGKTLEGEPCPPGGTIHGSFTLETSTLGTPVLIDFVQTL